MDTVLVTGANSGIGLALLKVLLKSDKRVVATVRASSLQSFQDMGFSENEKLIIRTLDVCDYAQGQKLIGEIDDKFGGVDVLVNNAGISYRSVVEHMTPFEEEHQMRVNYFGPFHLIRLALPSMRLKRRGKIINISSVGGMMAMPTMASYSASKFALEGATEALWYELKPWNIRVSLIQLGFVRSKSFQHVIMTERGIAASRDAANPYYNYYRYMSQFVEKLMLGSFSNPERIAKNILKCIDNDRLSLRISGTPDARFFIFLRRLLPRFIYHWILYLSLPHIRKWGPPNDST